MWPPVPPAMTRSVRGFMLDLLARLVRFDCAPPRKSLRRCVEIAKSCSTPSHGRSVLTARRRRKSLRRYVEIAKSCSTSSHDLAIFPIHLEQQRERKTACENRGAAEAHQWQGQALGWQQSHVDAHVDERLHAQPQTNAHRHEAGEITLEIDRFASNRERPL